MKVSHLHLLLYYPRVFNNRACMHLYLEQIKRSHSIYIAIMQIDTTSLQQIQIVFLCKLYHSEFSNMHVY